MAEEEKEIVGKMGDVQTKKGKVMGEYSDYEFVPHYPIPPIGRNYAMGTLDNAKDSFTTSTQILLFRTHAVDLHTATQSPPLRTCVQVCSAAHIRWSRVSHTGTNLCLKVQVQRGE